MRMLLQPRLHLPKAVKLQPEAAEARGCNRVELEGVLGELKQRWTPDGSFAVVATLEIPRPALGAARASSQETQPMPLRATGKAAEALKRLQGKRVAIGGTLRRRYYSRDNTPHWGQVEIWVDQCHPLQVQEDEHG